MIMRCLYCDKKYQKIRMINLFEDDPLCAECRKKLKGKIRRTRLEGINVYYLYEYADLFKNALLQYKEVHDEALKEIFIYPYGDIARILLKKYKVLYVPSSKKKYQERNFVPMEKILERYGAMKYADVLMREELVQANRSLAERKKMIDNYYIPKKIDKRDHILVVDDVLTSGSSLKGVIKAIDNRTKHILIFVLAIVRYDPKSLNTNKKMLE